VAGSPITTSGTLAISYDTGYEGLRTASSTQWNSAYASTSALSATAPITYAPSTGTIACDVASGSQPGCLSSADWTTFNGKQASGSYITALTGDATASGPGSVGITLATVNGNVGSFGGSTAIPNFTVNGKGLVTAAGTNAVVAPAGTLTGTTLASNVVTSSLTSVGTIANLTATLATLTSATTTNLKVSGQLVDSVNSVGTSGQVLTSTATSTMWATASAASGTISLASSTASTSMAVTTTAGQTLMIWAKGGFIGLTDNPMNLRMGSTIVDIAQISGTNQYASLQYSTTTATTTVINIDFIASITNPKIMVQVINP